jgi:hypothetical protein
MDITVTLDTPVTKTTVVQYVSFKIKDVTVRLNSIATFVVLLYGSNNEILCRKVLMEGQDYLDWGNDDTYAINYVKSKINDIVL